MAFDIEMIKKVYAEMPAKVDAARKALGRPLTLSEKILFAHLHRDQALSNFERGKSYVDFGFGRGNKQTKKTGHDFSDGVLLLENLEWKIAIQSEKELKTFP